MVDDFFCTQPSISRKYKTPVEKMYSKEDVQIQRLKMERSIVETRGVQALHFSLLH